MKRSADRVLATIATLAATACTTAGSTWMAQPVDEPDGDYERTEWAAPPASQYAKTAPDHYRTKSIGGEEESDEVRAIRIEGERLQGRVLGKFRNTYYDFPTEAEFEGELVNVHDAACGVIKRVPRGFFEALCVQGSGLLASGQTVSFSRRNCECATVCPRTQQKICFDALEQASFPWGRGALGKPITPLLTVAVDSNVIPMETSIYIPEYDGLPRDPASSAVHDGCFIAQDRGTKVVGKHVDIFTGTASITMLWNRLVPSNQGVTVVLDSPRCARESFTSR